MNLAEFIYTVLLKPAPLKKSVNFVIRALLPKTIRVHDAKIHINPADPVVSGALMFGVYENLEIEFFKRHFDEKMTFLDIGANVGLYTGLALSLSNGRGVILCFEPHPESLEFLRRTVEENSQDGVRNVHIFAAAASDTEGTSILYGNSDNKGDNRTYQDADLVEIGAISSLRIDDVCQANGIQEIQLVKIDVQGGEYQAIFGAKNILQKSTNSILISEFWPDGLRKAGSSAEQYLELLQSLGFVLYELTKRGLNPVDQENIIENNQGRQYANIVGLKGIYKNITSVN